MKDISVPLRLVNILSDGEFHSGEHLGEVLGMSRAGINKHIQTIRDWGIDVLPYLAKDIACQHLCSYWMRTRSPSSCRMDELRCSLS